MANANISKIGVIDAAAKEEASKIVEASVAVSNDPVAPNISERRVSGRREVPAPNDNIIVVENL